MVAIITAAIDISAGNIFPLDIIGNLFEGTLQSLATSVVLGSPQAIK